MPPESSTTQLILASASPRRRRLLEQAGIAFEAVAPGIDDAQLRMPPDGDPKRWVIGLAYLKACSLGRERREGDSLVLGADTVVVKQGEVIGQPRSEADATQILYKLESGWHEVITGVAIVGQGRRVVFAQSAKVCVGALGSERIDPYIASGQWRGKAGAYNLLERIDEGWPITYEGDPSTIMGLPMEKLIPLLERYGVRRTSARSSLSESEPAA